jgi:DNA polymerase III gamma/tau subunit
MSIETNLIGLHSVISQLNACIEQPPHIFLVGFSGVGKTTLAKDFLTAYFKHHGVTAAEQSELCVEISSHQDRGIHTFRQILNDHVRWVAPRKDVYRWIIIDDCDTLPAISQQALRRPMETYTHLTRFIFISQSQEALITPLQSRCHMMLIEPTNDTKIFDEILRREGLEKERIEPEAYMELITMSLCSVMKFQSLAKMLYTLKCAEGWDMLTVDYIKASFDPNIWGTMCELLKMLMTSEWDRAQKMMYTIWELGYSFEDILFELEHSIIMMNVIDHRAWYNIQQFLIKSWIYHSQSRSSILDLMTVCGEVKPWSIPLPNKEGSDAAQTV